MELNEMGIKIKNIDCQYSSSVLTYQIKLEYKEHEEIFDTVISKETISSLTTSIAKYVLDKLSKDIIDWKTSIDSGKLKPNKTIVLSTSFEALLDSLDASHTWRTNFRNIIARKSRHFEGNYYTINKDGLISFCPDGKEQEITPEGTWKLSNRNSIRPVKWLKRLLTTAGFPDLTTTEADLWASVCSAVSGDNSIQESEDLEEIYNMPHSDRNTIGDSCMRGDGHLYRDIQNLVSPTNLRIAYKVDPKSRNLIGRALLWDIEGNTYMDRIYSDGNTTEAYFKSYAQERGFFYREKQSGSSVDSWINPTGGKEKVLLAIKLNSEMFNSTIEVPYMDTMRWVYQEDGELYLSNDESNEKDLHLKYTLSNTEGCFYDTDDNAIHEMSLS